MRISGRRAAGSVVARPATATLLAGLTLTMVAVAHGGLLPAVPGMLAMTAFACLPWSTRKCSRSGGIAVLALGQTMGHLAWAMDAVAASSPARDMALGLSALDADPLPETVAGISAVSPMAGMPGGHAGALMCCCHVAAILVNAALVLALRLPGTVGWWLARVLCLARVAVMIPHRRSGAWLRLLRPSWCTHASPPLWRGPPVTA